MKRTLLAALALASLTPVACKRSESTTAAGSEPPRQTSRENRRAAPAVVSTADARSHPRFTCTEIVDFYARLRGVDRPRRAWALDKAGLSEVAREQTRILSGGMRQRLGLALLLLPDAPVLLLDEPGVSLDPA